ncbi:MAG: ABC transporter ATP-binding protein, partial [Desulfurococcales archaeon]|nr:ABC transporter ATP-binding protein [Desulfurococcales archaeon]
ESGEVLVEGQPLPKYLKRNRIKIQLIFQNPDTSLNPRQKVKDIIGEALQAAGHHKSRKAIEEILHDVGLTPDVMERYPHELSGGQKQRVAIARAVSVRPAFIVADEIISALDATIKVRILRLIKRLQEEPGFAMLFISHDLPVTASVSDNVAVIYAGRIMEYGKAWEVMYTPMHPYTAHLVSSVPKLYFAGNWRPPETKLADGTPPDTYEGCPLINRCPRAVQGLCDVKPPAPLRINGRVIACHNPLNVRVRREIPSEEHVKVLSR